MVKRELFDIVVKNGTLIDAAEKLHEQMDLGICKGKIEAVERKISSGSAKRVIDASGLIVTPGLIDLHTHVAYNVARLCVDPDQACLSKGTTTAVDAGSTGELTYTPFKKYVVESVKTRVLAFINIESLGMIEFADMKPRYTDQEWPRLITETSERFASMFVNVTKTVNLILKERRNIVGIKWAHHGQRPLVLARKAANMTKTPLMVENHFMPDAMKYLKQGDVITHLFHDEYNPLAKKKDGLVENGQIRQEFFDAHKRGILFDVGHGQGSFVWKIAELAFREGIVPQIISTDLWSGNLSGPVYDLPTTMSKFLYLGMTLDEVVAATTAVPAGFLKRLGSIGTLKKGANGDVAIFRIQKGRFPLVDVNGERRVGKKMLRAVHVIRGGVEQKIIYRNESN